MEKMSADRLERLSGLVAASLLDKLDDTDRKELDEWLAGSRHNRDFYERLVKSFSSGDMLPDISGYDSAGDWPLVMRKAARRRRKIILRNGALCAAAVACAVIALSIVLQPLSRRAVPLSEVAESALIESHRALLILPDGGVHDLENELTLDDGKTE